MKMKFKTNVIAVTLLVSNIGFSADVADVQKLEEPVAAESTPNAQATPSCQKPECTGQMPASQPAEVNPAA